MLAAASGGDQRAASMLFDSLYRELRRLAVSAMRAERGEHTLQPTALVHEAYMRFTDLRTPLTGRSHFFAIAATAMRRVLIEHARARNAAKRGGDLSRIPLDAVDVPIANGMDDVDIAALDAALTRLATVDERQARIVELRFFAGLTIEATADVVGISPRTVKREWQMARAWLRREMARDGREPG